MIARALLAALALLLPLQALAWCSLPPPANPSSAPPVQRTFGGVMCLPSVAGVVGKGQGYLQRDFAAVPGATARGGSAWGYWCPKGDGTWVPHTFACLDRQCPASAVKAVAAALAASEPVAALQAVIDGYTLKLTDWSETHDFNCLHSNMLQALQATKPAGNLPPVWRTPAGGSSVYPVASGKLGPPIAGRRAPGSALCDLALLKITSGSYTYGALAGGPATEAVLCIQAAL